MFLELVAVIAAGIGGAGIALLLGRLLGGRLPRWTAPVFAGAAMLGTTIASEYGWYGRTADALPADMIVAETVESRAAYRPWTYLVPYVDRFVAVDMATLRRHDDAPTTQISDLYFFGRWQATRSATIVADCAADRRAILSDGAAFAPDGQIEGLLWVAPGDDDSILRTICGGAG
ncbi:hypothetical protein SAMN05421688_0983 [Poseidonocella pacifica]|uniref:Uncharacterized protein n=1 Tax=Poseidonocella pacifica TaxID=871651 RepID=A0A1I0VTU4_9RHOB|nr:hypothetical protein [Poseidonocella pacifica]SFA79835.1 hypothetical protein SAMN05421688_0983 [Poseidonocella pacifica]